MWFDNFHKFNNFKKFLNYNYLRFSKFERSKLTIENPLNEIIIGLLLGEGHIQKRSLTGNSRIM